MPPCSRLKNRVPEGPHRARLSPRPCEENTPAEFSPLALRFCWLVFMVLHVFCGLYFASMSAAYWHLPGTTFGRWLYFYDLGMDPENHKTISLVHGFLAGIHIGYLLWMLGWSVLKQELVFAVYNVFSHPGADMTETHPTVMYRLFSSYQALITKIGLIGVDGPYFDTVLFCREVLETSLQTHQAYRMSQLLPRSQLNRSYISLLVVNCWSTTIVHFLFHGSYTKRRFYAIISDCTLDLVTSVGISIALLALYLPDFDFEIKDFPVRKWYEDVWVMHVISEFQILMVTSWGDLAMRIVFALSMIMNMNNMKKLLSPTVPRPLSHSEKSRPNFNRRLSSTSSVLPQHPSLTVLNTPSRRRSKIRMVHTAQSKATLPLFLTWGVVILALHLYAETIAGPEQCRMQLKPWFISEPSCSLLVLDCYESNLRGAKNEVVHQWSSFDPSTTAGVVIRHCPRLEVPDMLTKFSSLKLLKFYNSTIVSWNESAAVSQSNHPTIIMLFLVRVTLPDGLLPPGAHSADFPQGLADIEICHTNLRSLPDDLDSKWPQLSSIYIEACDLTEVPPSLARLAPYDLSLAMNPISRIPSTLLEGDLVYLHIGATRISELPEIVKDVSPLEQIRVDSTNISFFWSWIDPVIESAGSVLSDVPTTIVASNTPYCSDLQRIFKGDQVDFLAPHHEDQSRYLSDSDIENWATLTQAVECGEWPTILYPISSEDEYNGIKTLQ